MIDPVNNASKQMRVVFIKFLFPSQRAGLLALSTRVSLRDEKLGGTKGLQFSFKRSYKAFQPGFFGRIRSAQFGAQVFLSLQILGDVLRLGIESAGF